MADLSTENEVVEIEQNRNQDVPQISTENSIEENTTDKLLNSMNLYGPSQSQSMTYAPFGAGNLFLPIYINEQHWNISKKYIPYCIAMGIWKDALMAQQSMYGIYSRIILWMVSCTNFDSLFSNSDNFGTDLEAKHPQNYYLKMIFHTWITWYMIEKEYQPNDWLSELIRKVDIEYSNTKTKKQIINEVLQIQLRQIIDASMMFGIIDILVDEYSYDVTKYEHPIHIKSSRDLLLDWIHYTFRNHFSDNFQNNGNESTFTRLIKNIENMFQIRFLAMSCASVDILSYLNHYLSETENMTMILNFVNSETTNYDPICDQYKYKTIINIGKEVFTRDVMLKQHTKYSENMFSVCIYCLTNCSSQLIRRSLKRHKNTTR